MSRFDRKKRYPTIEGLEDPLYGLPSTFRTFIHSFAWETPIDVISKKSSFVYYSIPSKGDDTYSWLKENLLRGRLEYAHEIYRTKRRIVFDLDYSGGILDEFKKIAWRFKFKFEDLVATVLEMYFNVDKCLLKFRWLSSCRDGKISFHIILNGVVYNDDIGLSFRERFLERLYRLIEIHSRDEGLFDGFPIDRLIDHGPVTGVQFRMPYAKKRICDVIFKPLESEEEYELSEYLVCCWRKEDLKEFSKVILVNKIGIEKLEKEDRLSTRMTLPKYLGKFSEPYSTLPCSTLLPPFIIPSGLEIDHEVASGGIKLCCVSTWECPICDREHERENAFLYSRDNKLFLYCYRATRSTFIGEKSAGDHFAALSLDIDSKWIAYRRAIDLRLIMPLLPQKGARRYSRRRVIELKNDWKTLLIQSPMDTGKTFAVIKYIKRYLPKRVLFLTSRQDFAINLNQRLIESNVTGVVLYLDVPRYEDLSLHDRLMVQIESMIRLNDYKKRFDLIVLDESESILKQLSSETTMKDRRGDTYDILKRLLKRCRRLLLMDAFLTSRSISYVENIGRKNIKIHVNEWISDDEEKTAEDLVDWNTFKNVAKKAISIGKRVYFWIASKEKAKELYNDLFLLKVFSDHKILLYTADSSDSIRKELSNVNQVWSTCQAVILTPTVTVGISFDVIDYFDFPMIYASSYSCCVRDSIQATQRVRKFKYPYLLYALYDKPNHNIKRADSLWALRKDLEFNCSSLEKFALRVGIPLIQLSDTSFDIVENELLNRLEDQFSWFYFRTIWCLYLDHLGYIHSEIDPSSCFGLVVEVSEVKEVKVLKYKDMPSCVDLDGLRTKILSRNATDLEKAQWNKSLFHQYVSNPDDNTFNQIATLYDQIWCNPKKKYIILNLYSEKHSSLQRKPLISKLSIFSQDAQKLHRLEIIKKICSSLLLRHSADEDTLVSHDKIVALQLSEDEVRQIAPRKSRAKSRESITEKNLDLVNRVIRAWSGGKLKRTQRTQTKNNGVLMDTGTLYRLVSVQTNSWELLL